MQWWGRMGTLPLGGLGSCSRAPLTRFWASAMLILSPLFLFSSRFFFPFSSSTSKIRTNGHRQLGNTSSWSCRHSEIIKEPGSFHLLFDWGRSLYIYMLDETCNPLQTARFVASLPSWEFTLFFLWLCVCSHTNPIQMVHIRLHVCLD